MKRICIHQPAFVPYLGFFDRLLSCDLFIVLDDVQFIRRGWHHRDKIKTPRGPEWLSLILQKGDYHQKINEVLLRPGQQSWADRHLAVLTENYRRAVHFDMIFPAIEAVYGQPHEKLIDINMAFINFLFDSFNISIDRVMASDLAIDTTGNQRLIDLVHAAGGDIYLSGIGALDYLEPALFENAGIKLEIQDFHHPAYPQLHGDFAPYLSSLDVVLNCGPAATDIVRQCTSASS